MAADPDRLEKHVVQVLEEVRDLRQEVGAFRQQTNERFAVVEGDLALVKTASLDLSKDVKRIVDNVDDHETRIAKLEGAAE